MPLAFCFLHLLFDHVVVGSTFLRKAGKIKRTTRRHIPDDSTLHSHGCENLKFNVKPEGYIISFLQIQIFKFVSTNMV
jgi:hypothetical protein